LQCIYKAATTLLWSMYCCIMTIVIFWIIYSRWLEIFTWSCIHEQTPVVSSIQISLLLFELPVMHADLSKSLVNLLYTENTYANWTYQQVSIMFHCVPILTLNYIKHFVLAGFVILISSQICMWSHFFICHIWNCCFSEARHPPTPN